jgi:hypothetical protein
MIWGRQFPLFAISLDVILGIFSLWVKYGQSMKITTCTPDKDLITVGRYIAMSWPDCALVIGMCLF